MRPGWKEYIKVSLARITPAMEITDDFFLPQPLSKALFRINVMVVPILKHSAAQEHIFNKAFTVVGISRGIFFFLVAV